MNLIERQDAIFSAIDKVTPDQCAQCKSVLYGTSAAFQVGAYDEASPELAGRRAERIFKESCEGPDSETGKCRHPKGGVWVVSKLVDTVLPSKAPYLE